MMKVRRALKERRGILKKKEHLLKLGFQYWHTIDQTMANRNFTILEINLGNMQDLYKEHFTKRLIFFNQLNGEA